MGDSEIVVAQTNAVMGYASAAYTTTGYSDPSSNIIQEATTEISAPPADPTHPMPGDSNAGDGIAYSVDSNFVMQESHSYATYEAQPAAGVTHAGGNVVSSKHEIMALSQAAVYDSSATGVATSGLATLSSVEIGDASDSMAGTVDTLQFVYGSAMSAEEDRMWNIARAKSLDFNAWTALIEETEIVAEDNILKIREVYDAFLAEFPLYYKYWKKYADHEAHFGFIDKVVEVYERRIQDDTYSVVIWLHYCTFATSTFGDPDAIRRLFERGLAYVGAEYLPFALWDRYIDCEYMQKAWGQLVVIFSRILENPNQQLDRFLISFKELAGSRPLSELRTAKEAAAAASAASKDGVQANGKEAQPDDAEPSPAILTEAEGLEKFVAIQKEICKKAKEAESKIINFEAAIWRHYFHVIPISAAELENWNNYLDFNEREGDFDKRQPEIHLFAAYFQEQRGDTLGALAAYQLIHSDISPGLLEAIIKYANMECHLEIMKAAYSLFQQAIATEKEKDRSIDQRSMRGEETQQCLSSSGICGVISPKWFSSACLSACSEQQEKSSTEMKAEVSFFVFSVLDANEQRYYIAPINRENGEAPLVMATPMLQFDVSLLDSWIECQYAAGLYLFSNTEDRTVANNDLLWLFHPPSALDISITPIPQVNWSTIYGVSYFLGCSIINVYKILGIEWRLLGERLYCTMSIRTVRRNSQWIVEDEDWRRIPINLNFLNHDQKRESFAQGIIGVQHQGCLHWWCRDLHIIIAFDVDNERFRRMQTPFPGGGAVLNGIFELGGTLAAIALHPEHGLRLWRLVDYGNNHWESEALDRDFHVGLHFIDFQVPTPVSTPYENLVMIRSAGSSDRIWVAALVRDSGEQFLTRVVPEGWDRREGELVVSFTVYQDVMV